ncbi:hypothetical protein [Candidatus Sulfurimonas baltica]|uniref:Uncharacterized protein n=1 Tax=Candidatus Sulfurimonas baltica TaxID=2740404 RepID=A0A7S7LWH6_9BACT|nr:hypothetical protein [Candidatus Sulfurimonas baltica]QOY52748.1 hypothetical protein HUE88_03420 [Candidatus Sulfurimonas baltica]
MFGTNKELTEDEKLKLQIKNFDRDALEEKFFSLFNKYKTLITEKSEAEKLKQEEPKPIIEVKKEIVKTIDFSISKNAKRQRYLHKKYADNERILNGILNIYLDTNDKDLFEYLSKINKELELKEQTNQ